MSGRWFVSDTHFEHVNILTFCSRPFSSLEDMREKMIAAWNEVVATEDTVYHLGDAFMGRIDESTVRTGQRLNGHKVLVAGNHDKTLIKRGYAIQIFSEVVDMFRLSLPPGDFVLSHYPFEEWRETYHLHGHCHGSSQPKKNRLDVGVDATSLYRPISLDEVMERMPK